MKNRKNLVSIKFFGKFRSDFIGGCESVISAKLMAIRKVNESFKITRGFFLVNSDSHIVPADMMKKKINKTVHRQQ